MATYRIEPARDTLHGTFSREYPPILTIDSGDTVLFRTLNSGWVLEPPSFKNANVKQFEPRIKGRDDGHALCGPIAIRGARPGMTLEIRINEVRPELWGWTGGGGWENDVNKRLGLVEQGVELNWVLDAHSMIGRDQYGHTLALRPFLMGERYQLPRSQALALASLIVDLHVTQIANGVLGVHAVLPHDAMR